MKFIIDRKLPITPQVYEQVCLMIIEDKLQPNDKLLSVRDFAVEIGVNPNTIQKSYELLETSNVIYSVRGSGWYVSEDISVAKEIVEKLINKKINNFILEIEKLGINKEELAKRILRGEKSYE